jgi:hypothetical protein
MNNEYSNIKDWAGIILRAVGYLGGFFILLYIIKLVTRSII